MTNAALQAIRMIHESLNTPVIETLTAREMALLSHNLDRTGDVATLPNGDVYIWTVDRWSRKMPLRTGSLLTSC